MYLILKKWIGVGVSVLMLAPTACSVEKEKSAPTSESKASPTRAVPPLLAFAQPTSFQLELESSSSLPGENRQAELKLRGRLWLEAKQEGPLLRVLALLQSPQGLVNDKEQPEFQKMVAVMAKGASFVYQAGAYQSLAADKSLAPQVVNFWRMLASSLQYAEAKGAAASWRVNEYDSTGAYEASYHWQGEDLLRTKLEYQKVLQSGLALADLEQVDPKIIEGKTRMQLSQGRLHQLHLKEVSEANIHKGVRIQVSSVLRLSVEKESALTPALRKQLNSLAADKTLQVFRADQPIVLEGSSIKRGEFDEARMQGWTFEKALATAVESKQISGEPEAGDQLELRKRVYAATAALVGFLRSRPESIEKARPYLNQMSPQAQTLVSAAGQAGTPAAQELLIHVLQNEALPEALRAATIRPLCFSESLSEPALHVLLKSLKDERFYRPALLGLGSAGRRMRQAGHQKAFDEIASVIQAELSAASEARRSQLLNILSAVSNLGDERQLEALRPYIQSQDEKVQGAAIFALRHMNDPQVEQLVVAAFIRCASRQARLQILGVMRTRGKQQAYEQLLLEFLSHPEVDEQVRRRADALLASWKKQ